jgi:anti-anti-sigma regulatory factor
VCWGFADRTGFHEAAVAFLADGRRIGQRLLYISSEQRGSQRAALAPLGDVGDMLRRGDLRLAHIDEIYDPSSPIDSQIQLAAYATETNRALSDGYTGLRAAADATVLVADPARRAAHVRWESVADRYMASNPLAALCGYDKNAVPKSLLADLECVHPASHDGEGRLPYRLAYLDADTLALEGEIDTFSAAGLERMLHITLGESDHPGAIDLEALQFIDHRGLIALRSHSQERAVRLVRMPPMARRLCELLELTVGEM